MQHSYIYRLTRRRFILVNVSIDVTFYGVWGSTALPRADSTRFGGNTSCVVIETPTTKPIILDLGTGAIRYGMCLDNLDLQATVLLTHMHFDHVCGLPFFIPMLSEAAALEIYGPPTGSHSLSKTLNRLVAPPFFPVGIDSFAADIKFVDIGTDTFELSDESVTTTASEQPSQAGEPTPKVTVTSRLVPHTCLTYGYRIDIGSISIAYIPDHQQPADASMSIDANVVELADRVDLLIHDAQYPQELFTKRSNWGHSTPEYAFHIANYCGAKRLVLHSHDPSHCDQDLIDIENGVKLLAANTDLDVLCGSDGLVLHL